MIVVEKQDRPAAIVRENLRANVVRGPKKGTDDWYWRVRQRGRSDAGSDVWVGWGTRLEIVEKINSLEKGDAVEEVVMAGGEMWKKPGAVKGRVHTASVDRGPRSPVRGSPEWYWRIRRRDNRERVWAGWATVEGVQLRLSNMEGGSEVAETPKESKMLRVAIVSNLEHAKSVTRALRERGHLGFNFPELDGTIPPSMDVIICRIKSISHTAYNICNEEKRRGVRPVVFENGVGRAVEAVQAIAAGTWEEPTLAPEEDEEEVQPSEEAPLSDRQKRRDTCREAIEEIIDKGGLFTPVLVRRSPSQARDALQTITYPRDAKFRVTRTAVFKAFEDLSKVKEATVEAQFEELLSEGEYLSADLWWVEDRAKGCEKLLLRRELTTSQLEEFARGMTRPGRDYSVTEPEFTGSTSDIDLLPEAQPEEMLPDPEEPEEIDGVPVEHEAPVVEEEELMSVEDGPVVEVESSFENSEDEMTADEATSERDPEKELAELLELVAVQLDSMALLSVPAQVLASVGLCVEGSNLALAITHLATPDGAGCGASANRVSLDTSAVNCKSCQGTSMFKFAAWYSKQGGNHA